MSWFVYIIETENGKLYTGITKDVVRRFKEHLEGGVRGAKFFRSSPPARILLKESYRDRGTASKREYAIKRLSHRGKRELIAQVKNIKQL